MNREEALAELERMYNCPTTRHRVWDSLEHAEQRAISLFAGASGMCVPTARESMTREHFERCWHVLERFARLSSRIVAANDNARADEQARAAALVADATRSAA